MSERQANARRELARVKSESGYRRIEAPPWLMAALAKVKLRSTLDGPDDLCTRTGEAHGHGNVLARGLYPALDRAGVPQTSFHSLRHTHASLWIMDGGDVITLFKRLGMRDASGDDDDLRERDPKRRRLRSHWPASRRCTDSTEMATLMAARDGQNVQQTADANGAEVVSLSEVPVASQ